MSEERAQAFAQELLVPVQVLRHVAQRRGVRWDALTPLSVAQMMADTHVEHRMIVKAASEAGFLGEAGVEHALALDVSKELPEVTERALWADEYFQKYPEQKVWFGKRIATLPPIKLRLPVAYVKAVVDAVANCTISWSKGAELLMIDRRTFEERFGGTRSRKRGMCRLMLTL